MPNNYERRSGGSAAFDPYSMTGAARIGGNTGKRAPGYRAMRAPERAKKALLADIKAMDEGRLGLSEQEKGQLAMGAQQAAAQQAGAQQRELQRQTMAAGQSPFMGQAAQLQRDIGEQSQQAAAQAHLQADELSRQLSEARRQEIRARLDRQQDLSREKSKKAVKAIKDIGGIIAKAVAAGMTGGAAAVGPAMMSGIGGVTGSK